MKYWGVLVFLLPLFSLYGEPLALDVQAEGAILINADTGVILYEKNAHQLFFPASITKIVTAALTLKLKRHELQTLIKADSDSIASVTVEAKKRSNYKLPAWWIEQGGTHMGIKKGEELSLKDLLYGSMVASANDATNLVACYTGGGSISRFVEMMNEYVKALGCQHSHFCNPHGIHHPAHQTTAYDMAKIAKDAMKDPLFREIVSTVRYTRPKTDKQAAAPLIQSNLLLRNGKYHYSKAIGIKTGYTSIAQNTFVGAATDQNRTLIVVLLKCKNRQEMFAEAKRIFETAFNQPKVQRILIKAGSQTYQLKTEAETLKTYTKEGLSWDYYPSEEPSFKCLLYWDKLKFPIQKGQQVGKIVLQVNQKVEKEIALYAENSIEQTWGQWLKGLWGS